MSATNQSMGHGLRDEPAQWRQMGPYLLQERIGRGGAADVYAAQGPEGAVAVKVCHSKEVRTRLRFSREVAALRQLRHPGLVRLYQANEEADPAWYAMEYLGRITLRDVLNVSNPMSGADLPSLVASISEAPSTRTDAPRGLRPAMAVSVIMTIAGAMAHAHSRGIIHRDLKPENIMMRANGTPVVIDVGIALDLDDQRLTASGMSLGTMAYMAPEQLHGGNSAIDEGCDIYALGQILSEVLTGKTVRSHDGDNWRRLRGLAKPLQLMIRQATAETRQQRYASMDAMVEDCQRYLNGEMLVMQSRPWWIRTWQQMRWRPRLTAVAMMMCILVGAGAGAWWWQQEGVRWQSSTDLFMPAGAHLPPQRDGAWSREGGMWSSRGPASVRTQAVYPSQIEVELRWRWQGADEHAAGPFLDFGLIEDRPPAWRVGILRPGIMAVWWHGQPWWCGRFEALDDRDNLLRVRFDDWHGTLWYGGRMVARWAVPASFPAGALQIAAPETGVFELMHWRFRLPTVPGLVHTATLSHNLLGEATAAPDESFPRWYAVTQAAFNELADSRAHPGPVLDSWQVALALESLRRARLAGAAGEEQAEAMQARLRDQAWRLDLWQQRSVTAAIGEAEALAALNRAAAEAPPQQLQAWATWLLQRRCEYERAATSPARSAIAARLPADDPHHLLWQDW